MTDETVLDHATEIDPVELLTKAWTDDAPPKEEELSEEADETNEEQPEEHAKDDADPSDEEVQDDDGEEDGEEGAEKAYADDDVYVKHVVDGEEREFSIKDLKRLAGQEASLTRKSQEVAAQRTAVDNANQANQARLQGLMQRALERWKPYEQVNLLVAAKQLEPEQLQALQTEMQARWEDVVFLQQEHDGFSKEMQKTAHEDLIKSARECIKVLSDPSTGIDGWNEQMYGDLCNFAKSQGVSTNLLSNLTDPGAFKIIRDAMLYRQGQKTVQTAKDKAAKTNKGKTPPKKIVKGSANAAATRSVVSPSKSKDAVKKLRDTGTRDDAVDALMAMWSEGGE